MFVQNIECDDPNPMFWSKLEKNMYTPAIPSVFCIKVGFNGVYFSWTCFPDKRHFKVDINSFQMASLYMVALKSKRRHDENLAMQYTEIF